MGFSVSGSAAILFIAAFVCVGILYSAAYNGYERVQDATEHRDDRVLERHNTEVAVTNVSYSESAGELTVNVTNEGVTSLSVNETDLLVNGTFANRSEYTDWSVDGATNTTLWLPGETYSITVEASDEPDRVKVVSPLGVAAAEVV